MKSNRTIAQVKRHAKIRRIAVKVILGIVIYSIALLYFFPILYMFLSAFKTEFQAVYPSLVFDPTLATMQRVLTNPRIIRALQNSLFHVVVGTSLALLLGVPAAFQLAFGQFRKKTTNEKLFVWFLV
ncbi:MAG: carbohydrate ABC transporter permease, partial [Spirochaetaceae bacterium]